MTGAKPLRTSRHPTPLLKNQIRWVRYVARMGTCDMSKIFWLESLKRRGYSEDIAVDGMIILKRISR